MKKTILIFAALLIGLSSCAYKTCPTYAEAPETIEQQHTTEKV